MSSTLFMPILPGSTLKKKSKELKYRAIFIDWHVSEGTMLLDPENDPLHVL